MKDSASKNMKILKQDSCKMKDLVRAIFKRLKAYIIFVDIRNYSHWSNREGNDDDFREKLLQVFYEIIQKYFPLSENFRKLLGDGMLIIRRYEKEEFSEVLSKLLAIKKEFNIRKEGLNCEGFSFDPLGIGIGMSIGFVREVVYTIKVGSESVKGKEEMDYLGYLLNLTSRYCDFARPQGIVIDYDSTLKYVNGIKKAGFKEEFLTEIKGFTKKKVWRSCEVRLPKIHPAIREDEIHKIEVHVAGVCIQKDDGLKVLIGKRSNERRLYPGLWECGGGQVHRKEEFEEAIKRQFKEEFGVIIDPVKAIGHYKIVDRENDTVIPGIKFCCRFIDYIEEKIWLDEAEFVEYRWILLNEMDRYEFIPGIKEDIREAVRVYQNVFGRGA